MTIAYEHIPDYIFDNDKYRWVPFVGLKRYGIFN